MTPGSKSIRIGFTLFIILLGMQICVAQPTDNSAKCKQLAIDAATWGKNAYEFSKMAYMEKASNIILDSALYCLKEVDLRLDSCVALASDSDFLAVSFARMSKTFSDKAQANLRYSKTVSKYKREYIWDATAHCTQVVIDAYHASFYFEGAKPEEKKPEELPAAVEEKKITKLDVDQALFALLNEQLHEKTTKHKKEIEAVKEKLKTSKDPVSTKKLKDELKKLESEESVLSKRNIETSEKLSKINGLIEERDKNKGAVQAEETVFAKGLVKIPDEWNKQMLSTNDLPNGLVYQVQIGVYNNAIVPEIFKGLTPIFKTDMPGGVLYSTGVFEKLSDAQEAKLYVKSMGLGDAFVTAYHNHNRH